MKKSSKLKNSSKFRSGLANPPEIHSKEAVLWDAEYEIIVNLFGMAVGKGVDFETYICAVLKQRFESRAEDINKRHPDTECTFLIKALYDGNLGLAALLLETPSVDVTAPVPKQFQPEDSKLRTLSNQKTEYAESLLGLFLRRNATETDETEQSTEGRTLIWRVLKLFAKRGVDINEKINGKWNLVSWLIANHQNSLLGKVLSEKETWVGHERLLETVSERPLTVAAIYGNVAAVRHLLKVFPLDALDQVSEPSKRLERDSTKSVSSSKKSFPVQFDVFSPAAEELVKMMIKDTNLLPQPDISTDATFTPLLAGIFNAKEGDIFSYLEICQILLEEKLKGNRGIEDKETPHFWNMLHLICYKKALPFLKKVIEIATKYPSSQKIFSGLLLEEDKARELPLHYALGTFKKTPPFSLEFAQTLLSLMQRVCSPEEYKMAIRKRSARGTPLQQLVKEIHLSVEKIKIFEQLWREGAGKFDTEVGVLFDFSPLKEIMMSGNLDKKLLSTIFEFYKKDSDYQKLEISRIDIPRLVDYELKKDAEGKMVRHVILKNDDTTKQLLAFFERTNDVEVLNCAAGKKIPSSHRYLKENSLLFSSSTTFKSRLSEEEALPPLETISFLSNRFSLSSTLQTATRLNKTPRCFYLLYSAHSSFRGVDPGFYKISCDGVYEVAGKGESGLKSLSGQTTTISLHFQQKGEDIFKLDYSLAKKEYKIASIKSRVLAAEIKSDCGQYTLYLGCIYLPEGAHSKEDKAKIQKGNFFMVIDLDDFIGDMLSLEAKIAGEKLRLESNNNNNSDNLNVTMKK